MTQVRSLAVLTLLLAGLLTPLGRADGLRADGPVDTTTLRGKVMCGYQGWFRCPGDGAGQGWIHWSRDSHRLASDTLSFEMWPDMGEYSPQERFPAPGFTPPDGRPAALFSSDNAATVRRHFQWMRDYGLDGAWLQHFLVDLPGGPNSDRYPSRMRVLHHVQTAARQTGRVWALAYDIAGMPADRIYDALTADWTRMIAAGIPREPRYLHDRGRPVVLIWGFYDHNAGNAMTPALANRLIDFFHAPGPNAACLVVGGDWTWRANPDPAWRAFTRRFDAYAPWNVGNYERDAAGAARAATGAWAGDLAECRRDGRLWLPVVYPGFSWDNLKRQPPGTSTIPRRGGRFLWEQFHALARMKATSVYVAMFDEGTAIFKVTSSPPTQARFVGYDGLPSDWYLRLVGEGARMLRGRRPITSEIPFVPHRVTPPAGTAAAPSAPRPAPRRVPPG